SFIERRVSRVHDDIFFMIKNLLQAFLGNIQKISNPAGKALKIPDVGDGGCELDMTHTFTADLGKGYFNAAPVANDVFVLNPFILSTITFPVLGWTEDPLTKKSISFRFKSTVVNSFRLLNLTMGPGPDLFGRG